MKAIFEIEVDFDPEVTDEKRLCGTLDLALGPTLTSPWVMESAGSLTVGEFRPVIATKPQELLPWAERRRVREVAFEDVLRAMGVENPQNPGYGVTIEGATLQGLEGIRDALMLLKSLGGNGLDDAHEVEEDENGS